MGSLNHMQSHGTVMLRLSREKRPEPHSGGCNRNPRNCPQNSSYGWFCHPFFSPCSPHYTPAIVHTTLLL